VAALAAALAGTPFFVKQAYYRRIAAAEAAGNTALANSIRNTDKQPSGRSNNWRFRWWTGDYSENL
jgi:hypothetical protein